jgi:hypothetical protein
VQNRNSPPCEDSVVRGGGLALKLNPNKKKERLPRTLSYDHHRTIQLL